MTNKTENNKRIAKNTILLYLRMLFIMAINLYTSRIILKNLGIVDYGIYNVVGGVVAMFGFLNGAMASSTQRYLTFELGKNDYIQLQKVFNTSIQIHALISFIIIVLAETIGMWFLLNKMVIPIDRMDAAMWVYHFAILSTVVLIMSVPYNATIIAHEKMSAFAYISVLEVILKLIIVYMLQIGTLDKLKLYAVLFFLVQLSIRFIYSSYCRKHFEETKLTQTFNRKLFKEMLFFAGWNLWGNCAAIACTQGVNILLNMFFGPVVNAARGIAVQVQNAISQFSINFQTALNPQITKAYAVKDYNYMHNLIYKSSKFTFFLLLLISLPVVLETETILKLWLGTVPDYTISFLRIMLCTITVDAVANSLMTSAAATGKVRTYQSIVGGILLTILPISYVVLKNGGSPVSVFIVHLCICIVAFISRLYIIRPMINLSISAYFNEVIIKCIYVCLASLSLPLLLYIILPDNIFTFFIKSLVCILNVIICIYILGLKKNEKKIVQTKLNHFLSKRKVS